MCLAFLFFHKSFDSNQFKIVDRIRFYIHDLIKLPLYLSNINMYFYY